MRAASAPVVLGALAATLVAGVPVSFAAGGFAAGVAAGEVTSSSAILWARAPAPGRVELRFRADSPGGAGSRPYRTVALRARAADDLTVQRRVPGLRPGTRYAYEFRQGTSRSAEGTFTTAPRATAAATVRFAVSGDADATRDVAGKPGFNRFETYAAMARERNDFNVNMGDTMYSDSAVGGAPPALTVPAKWAKYRLGLGLEALRRLRAAAGLYSHWDDHEFRNDFSRAEHGDALYAAGVKAFRDYAPVAYSPQAGLFRTVRWGRNVELFFLDERSFRSATAARACGNDLAPTAPTVLRKALALLAPPLARPVPAGCLSALRDPSRTMLGAAQYAAFTTAIRASTATWKVVLNEVPLMQLYALPYDRWEGYAAERARLLADLAPVENVVVLTTDVHAHLIGEIRKTTFEAPGPVSTGIWEVVTGPVATSTYAKKIESALGAPGAGRLITSLFLEPSPPTGLGLRCAATDTYGYAQVAATATTLTVTPKTAAGTRVRARNGAVCAPVVLTAR